MTDQNRQNQTATPPLRYHNTTLTIEGLAGQFETWAESRRDALMRELVELEKQLGYGRRDKPTTSELRALWREHSGRCPHCGGELR